MTTRAFRQAFLSGVENLSSLRKSHTVDTTKMLLQFTVKQLKALCKEKGIRGYSKLRKLELVEIMSMYFTSVESIEAISLL